MPVLSALVMRAKTSQCREWDVFHTKEGVWVRSDSHTHTQ